MSKMDLSKLEQLPPDARTRVEEALKRTLEIELANVEPGIGGASEAQAFSRSKGIVFSRSKSPDQLRDLYAVDKLAARNLESLDDAAFAKFADRLSALKRIAKNA